MSTSPAITWKFTNRKSRLVAVAQRFKRKPYTLYHFSRALLFAPNARRKPLTTLCTKPTRTRHTSNYTHARTLGTSKLYLTGGQLQIPVAPIAECWNQRPHRWLYIRPTPREHRAVCRCRSGAVGEACASTFPLERRVSTRNQVRTLDV